MADIRELKTAIKIKNEQLELIQTLEKIKASSDKPIIDIIRYISEFFCASSVIIASKENGNYRFYSNVEKKIPNFSVLAKICSDSAGSGKSIIINDIKKHKMLHEEGVRNILVLPLNAKEKVLGCLIIINKSGSFTSLSLKFCIAISRTLSSLMKQMELVEELEMKKKEVEVLREIDKIRDTIKDFDLMIKASLNEILKAISAEAGFFILYDRKEMSMQFAGKSEHSGIIKKNKDKIIEFAHSALEHGCLVHERDIGGLKNGIALPIILDDDKKGVIGLVNSKEMQFTKQDKEILSLAGCQIDSAVFEDFEKKQIKKVFGRYVAPEIMEDLLKRPDEYLRSRKQEVTVLFSDLRGFTAMSEKLEPEEVVEILNEHFEVMTKLILKHRGTIDKFVGDEIMAIFGAPVFYEGHAIRAVKCALEMQKEQEKLTRSWKKKYKVEVNIGVGINTGEAIVGTIGSSERVDYTAIGDTINVGARLCSKALGRQVLVSSVTRDELGRSAKVSALEPMELKGKSKLQNVYAVEELR